MSAGQDIPITMTMQDWQITRAGLLELPGKHGLPVLMKLERQLQPYLEPRPNGELRQADEARE